jgi:hypothetical protein
MSSTLIPTCSPARASFSMVRMRTGCSILFPAIRVNLVRFKRGVCDLHHALVLVAFIADHWGENENAFFGTPDEAAMRSPSAVSSDVSSVWLLQSTHTLPMFRALPRSTTLTIRTMARPRRWCESVLTSDRTKYRWRFPSEVRFAFRSGCWMKISAMGWRLWNVPLCRSPLS